jgi:hypothetical protein
MFVYAVEARGVRDEGGDSRPHMVTLSIHRPRWPRELERMILLLELGHLEPPGPWSQRTIFDCQSIITAMRGEITVESTMGKGTCFRVLLPAATANAAPVSA